MHLRISVIHTCLSAGVIDLRGWKGSYTVGANQILIALDKALAYDVLGLSTVWVALK